ncbi:sporulation protein YunB [Clostridium sp. LIBA-8841]|uniref:sporulation protein YunB n=1 Tax=Clostridium sp. LIBA-8841 TaxID=2987530 RepID=UPI002AC7581B|nr:sporulation protein YunB [Clostridium sp. LIBA-8841]MDZ5252907.1 sporulation protein YunB [Clostridium sp. LIBA-8841]
MYYVKKNKHINIDFKKYLIIIIIIIIAGFISFIYAFDKIIAPTVLLVADSEMRAKTLDVINKNIVEVYTEKFDYDNVINVEKDSLGDIKMLKADTIKLNDLATEVAIKSQADIKEIGSIGVKMPIGYITKNNIMSYWGPSITVKMEPIGRVEVSYDSIFESAGINQTRHKILVDVKTNLKIILPLQSKEVEVVNQIPISDTVIVGEVPKSMWGSNILQGINENVEDNN